MDRVRPELPRLLSIAGSDSGGGAGIQADLKAFARCGCHGMTAITAVTAQNTVGVTAVQAIDADVIVAQVRAVVEDIGVDAVKIGMLANAPTVAAVSDALDLLPTGTPIVVDPVMVAESGAVLLEPDARDALVESILPRATVTTPNLVEASVLAGGEPEDATDAGPEALARAVHALGPAVAVVTGGHRGEPVDVFFDGAQLVSIGGEREPGGAAHGSGCTHSSALAAQLALGLTPLESARAAKAITAQAVRDGLRGLGAGPGPVDVLGLAARAARAARAREPGGETA